MDFRKQLAELMAQSAKVIRRVKLPNDDELEELGLYGEDGDLEKLLYCAKKCGGCLTYKEHQADCSLAGKMGVAGSMFPNS